AVRLFSADDRPFAAAVQGRSQPSSSFSFTRCALPLPSIKPEKSGNFVGMSVSRNFVSPRLYAGNGGPTVAGRFVERSVEARAFDRLRCARTVYYYRACLVIVLASGLLCGARCRFSSGKRLHPRVWLLPYERTFTI